MRETQTLYLTARYRAKRAARHADTIIQPTMMQPLRLRLLRVGLLSKERVLSRYCRYRKYAAASSKPI